MDDLELTPEQQKEIGKLVSQAKWRLVGIAAKFSVGLFSANLASLLLGALLLKDIDPQMQVGFQFLCIFTNTIFMSVYLSGQIKKSNDTLSLKVQEILNKNVLEEEKDDVS